MTLQDLERRNPEWRPWLAQAAKVLAELDDPAWDAAVPQAVAPAEESAPLVAAAAIDSAAMEALLGRLPRAESVAPLRAMPLLHACRRRWAASVPTGWSRGYCPICGAWPAFAEVCGVERNRFLRCARCGSAWRAHALACPYCTTTDHAALASLVAAEGASSWAIEVCRRCSGYLKVFTRLQPGTPGSALIEDLASAELDLAAEARGYRRPHGLGYPVDDAA